MKFSITDFTFLPNVMSKMVQKLLVENMQTKKKYAISLGKQI